MSFVEARNRAIAEAMAANDRTVLIGGGFGGPGSPEGGFGKAYGSGRVRSTPISEEGFAGVAVGASLYGLRPLVGFSNASFMFDAWEPVLNEAALLRYMSAGQFTCPIVFHMSIGLRAGWAAQHSETYRSPAHGHGGTAPEWKSFAPDHCGRGARTNCARTPR